MDNTLNLINENKINNNIELINNQNNFIETTLGKTINMGLDIGLRALLPDFIENQVIEIKNTIIKEGFAEGVNKAITSAIDLGKSALGIFTGKFDNISQIQTAIKSGGIIDSISNVIDFALGKASKKNLIPYGITQTIKQGKNVLLNNISSNIENEFNKQLDSIEKLQKYENNWKEYFNLKDFKGMQKEYIKIKEKLKELVPLENTLNEARRIENLHNLIKNNGNDFNLTPEQLKLAEMLN